MKVSDITVSEFTEVLKQYPQDLRVRFETAHQGSTWQFSDVLLKVEGQNLVIDIEESV